MANPANSVLQNLLPVQAYFAVDGTFQTFIGQGVPFYATFNPVQSGLTITNSTIDSSTIGATSPSTGVFTNISTTTGTISTTPSANTDIANKFYVDTVAQGLGPKAACAVGSTVNITTLSGLLTIDGYTVTAGQRVLVKNQTASQDNGIYVASASAWTRATDMDVWSEVPGAYTVLLSGGQANTGWVCTATATGTIGVTAMPWVQFSGTGAYFAGTGLTLASNTFSITNTGVTAASYGSASQSLTATVNAQGQLTSLADTNIAIGATQITSGTIDTARISGSYTGITGVGTLTAGTWNASTIGVAYGGSGAATFTAGYLKASGTSAFTTVASIPNTDITGLGTMSTQNANAVAITGGTISGLSSPLAVASGGTGASTLTGYVKGSGTSALTASATIPSTDITGLGTMSTQNANAVTITGGSINGTTIGATTPSTGAFTTGAFTTITASTSLTTPIVQATNSGGLSLKNSAGTTQMSMGAGGGDNISLNVSTNLNGTNAQIDISPTGTGHVHMKPSGSGAIEIAPTSVGTIDNMTIGATTAKNGSFVDLSVTGTTSFDGSQGSSGQVLTSAGSGNTPTWTTPTSYATVTDDTTTNAVRYPLFAAATSGNLTTEYVSSTKYQFNPSTGVLTATQFTGSGAGLTSIPNSALTNSSITVGSTGISLGGSATTIAGLTSVTSTTFVGALTGNASTATSATTATNATNIAITDNTSSVSTYYPVISSASTGNVGATTSSTKLSFVPNTGTLTATNFSGLASSATNIAGGANLQIPYNTGVGATSFIAAPTIATTYLQYNGTGFAWATVTATTATNLAGGTLGSIPYQSALNTTLFLAGNATTTPQFVTSTGVAGLATAPTLTSSTGSGNVVLATSPTLVTPALGTPSALVGTNITGTASGLSIGGNAATATTATNATNTAITDDTATNAVVYPTWVTANTGNLPQKVSSTKMSFNPSTGALTVSQLIIAP